ncbi:unnamed protein product, partial [Hapterophycus canaliculatus]
NHACSCAQNQSCVSLVLRSSHWYVLAMRVQLGDAFYDLTGWRKVHPAGNHWIDRY